MVKGNFKNCWAVILSGGNGTRFWPRSRKKKPKQLLCISDRNLTMLEVTLKRLDPIIPPERRIIVTNTEQVLMTKELVGDQCHSILSEPVGKNTAAAIALAAFEVRFQTNNDEKVQMISFHADHLIKADDSFYGSLEEALFLSKKDKLCLLGVTPTRPAIEYGYIEASRPFVKEGLSQSYSVEKFYEKPNLEKANEYIAAGYYYWNSGIFVWNNNFLLDEISFFLKNIYESFEQFYTQYRDCDNCFAKKEFGELYSGLESISIDCGLLEKSKNIAVVGSKMEWRDVGSWDALSDIFSTDESGNLSFGDVYFHETKNSIVDVKNKFVAVVGVKDLIVIEEGDSLLLCHKDCAQKVKNVVAYLKENKKDKFL